VFIPVNIAKKTWAQGLFTGNWWNVSLYNVTGLYGFHGYDAYRYVRDFVLNDDSLPAKETNEAGQWFNDRGDVRKALEKDPMFGAYKGSNVILIQAEAFQNFMIRRFVGGQEVTPNLNKLIGNSVYFDHFYNQTALGRTSDADFGAQCSQQPMVTGSVFIRYAQSRFDCSASILKNNGYTTSVLHAYDGGFWNRNAMYKNMNYDMFYSKKHFNIDEPVGWSLGDDSFFRQSTDLMAAQQSPFYSFLITLSSHHPFKVPKKDQTLDIGEFEGTIFGDYLQATHYVDASMGHFIEQLKAKGLWDKTIVMFYGDHDNSIHKWEPFEKFLGKPLSPLERDQILRQVPFIVHLPDEALKGTREDVGGQLDISPTIQHLLGISSAREYMIGTPLVMEKPLAGKSVVFRNGSYTDDTHYLLRSDTAGTACFNTATGQAIDLAACKAGAEAARTELVMSDRIVNHNLIAKFRADESSATPAK
jgi:phosphoglycerol transferase MdoB-like AlkP superfamily enzyme